MTDRVPKQINRDPIIPKVRITVSFHRSTYNRIRNFARAHDMSMSLLINEIVREWIEKNLRKI